MEIIKEKVKLIWYWTPSIIFNIVETIIIIVIGICITKSIGKVIYIVAAFEITRHIIKKDKHYKNPFKCLISTTLILSSIFMLANIDLIFLGTGASILAAYVLSGNADIEENKNVCVNENVGPYLWKKGKPSKYKDIEDYVRENKDSKKLKEFEDFLKGISNKDYNIYYQRFYNNISQSNIVEKTGLSSTARLTEHLDNIHTLWKAYNKMKNG